MWFPFFRPAEQRPQRPGSTLVFHQREGHTEKAIEFTTCCVADLGELGATAGQGASGLPHPSPWWPALSLNDEWTDEGTSASPRLGPAQLPMVTVLVELRELVCPEPQAAKLLGG